MPQKLRERPATTRSALHKVKRTTTASMLPAVDHLPHARAYAGPPCRGRSLWAVTVLTCPHCGGMHQHRVGAASRLLGGRVDRVCPVTGRVYLLAPVQRRREARRV